MCKMYGIIEALCTERGIKPGKLCADLGISRGIMSDLKAGRTKRLSAENIGKVSAYFGVSSDYLLGVEQKETLPSLNARDKQGIENRNLIRIAGRDGSYRERMLTDEQLAAFNAMLDALPEVPDDL